LIQLANSFETLWWGKHKVTDRQFLKKYFESPRAGQQAEEKALGPRWFFCWLGRKKNFLLDFFFSEQPPQLDGILQTTVDFLMENNYFRTDSFGGNPTG